MFGMDRVAGQTEKTALGREFWAKMDKAGAWYNWPLYHIPAEPLKSELLLLAAKIQEPTFNSLMLSSVTNPELRALVKQNGKLMFNFAYASWNGGGWFGAFGAALTKVYEAGMKDPIDLAEYFVNMRINNDAIYKYKPTDSGYKLIRQGGFKIASKLGITPITTREAWVANVGSKLSRTSDTIPA
jgi:hypothetical protein